MESRLRILHLEDDPADAELVAEYLRAEGLDCETVRVETREDFLAAVLDCRVDLIFADYALPAFDGLSALEIARSRCPDVPFIFVSGRMGEELAIESLKGGATDYVLKQRLSRLGPAVHRALHERRESQQRRQAEEELERHREHLEDLVRERTSELETANAHLRAAYKDMESFSYSASHDLRTPLVTMVGFSALLQERYAGGLDDDGKHMLNALHENAKRMDTLIEEILAFSRVSSSVARRSNIDMQALTEEVLAELTSAGGGRSLEILVRPLPPACGDRAMVRQVLANLLSNAVKYSAGRERARIEIGVGAEGDENVYYVRDDGVGFDMQFQGRLFGLFQRLHGAGEFKGSGVGLAIVKRIVEKHGGRVWAEGKVGEGATFSFTLPGKC